jgi:type VI secretion system protein ImpG
VSDRLLEYYERELAFLRRSGAEFATAYPKVAGRLELEANKCEDPHVERLLEGFAFLAARVHLRLDDDLPEVSEALLASVHPQYVRPFPSVSIAGFDLDPSQSQLADGFRVPRGSRLQSRPVAGEPCRFRTCFDTVVWPLEIDEAEWIGGGGGAGRSARSREAVGAVRLGLKVFPGGDLAELNLDRLRLHLSAEPGLAAALYELLLNHCLEVVVRDPTRGSRVEPFTLPPDAVTPVGFRPEELLLDPPRRSLLAYSLLQEYFVLPEKFYFLDVAGLETLRARGFSSRVELTFQVRSFERSDWRNRLDDQLRPASFRLGCTPVVNLFGRTSEPLLLNQRHAEYPVIPDLRRRDSILTYSVDEVRLVSPDLPQPRLVQPFYAPVRSDRDEALFWRERRRSVQWGGEETNLTELCFVDASDRTVYPDQDVATLRLTCYSGDLPSRLPIGGGGDDFRLEGGGPLRRIEALLKPTPSVTPALGRSQIWRLVSQLSLNYGSLLEGGAVSLRQLLQLQNLSAGASGERQIRGLREVESEPTHARVRTEHGISFARGHRIDLLFDEDDFAGGSVYLLASVLDRFFGLYTSMNSFTTLRARSLQRKDPVGHFPPRAGWKALI